MTEKEFTLNYWRQYKLLEKDLIDSADYVTVSKRNYPTFSNQYLKLLLCACGEIEAVLNELLDDDDGYPSVPQKILHYLHENENFAKKELKTAFPFEEIHFKPFVKFSKGESGVEGAPWWKAYNELKHNRHAKNENSGRLVLQDANLENVLNALAALCLLSYELAMKSGVKNNDNMYMKSHLFEFV